MITARDLHDAVDWLVENIDVHDGDKNEEILGLERETLNTFALAANFRDRTTGLPIELDTMALLMGICVGLRASQAE